MSTYKYGSLKLSHENAGLNVPSLQWLGVQSQDVLAGNGQEEYSDLLRLSARDRKKAADMLERSEVLQEGGMEEEWRRELQVMLMLNVKVEMEILADRDGGMKGWVEEKLLENGTGLHADEDLLGTHQLADVTLGGENLSSLPGNEELMIDIHETPDVQIVGEDSLSLQADDGLLETHQLANMTLDEKDLFGLQADEDLLLDTHEMPDVSAVAECYQSLQADEGVLDTYEMADILTAEGNSPSLEWDEEL